MPFCSTVVQMLQLQRPNQQLTWPEASTTSRPAQSWVHARASTLLPKVCWAICAHHTSAPTSMHGQTNRPETNPGVHACVRHALTACASEKEISNVL